jgi:hypothetical protein
MNDLRVYILVVLLGLTSCLLKIYFFAEEYFGTQVGHSCLKNMIKHFLFRELLLIARG